VLTTLITEISADRWDHLHELYAEDTVVEHPLARDASRRLEGREALRRHFAAYAGLGRRLRARDVVWHETTDPELVIAEFVYEGTGPGSDDRYEMAACFIWRVRNGLITRCHDYLDQPRPITGQQTTPS
jgi:ketosteroid isomerase-like protein